jgi:hypothetical protein
MKIATGFGGRAGIGHIRSRLFLTVTPWEYSEWGFRVISCKISSDQQGTFNRSLESVELSNLQDCCHGRHRYPSTKALIAVERDEYEGRYHLRCWSSLMCGVLL